MCVCMVYIMLFICVEIAWNYCFCYYTVECGVHAYVHTHLTECIYARREAS